MRASGLPGIVAVWQRSGQLAAKSSPIASYLALPTAMMEAKSYNPSNFDALATVTPIAGADERMIASAADLDRAILEASVDVVICEADCPVELLLSETRNRNASLWQFNECWSDALPTRYVRSWIGGADFVETSLDEISPIGGRRTLAFTRSQVAPRALTRGMHGHFWKLAHMPLRVLSGHVSTESVEQDMFGRLTVGELLRLNVAQFFRRAVGQIVDDGRFTWALAIGPSTEAGLLPSKLDDFQPIVPPSDRFWADPFLVSENGRTYMFFEELSYESSRGHIAVVEVNAQGRIGEPVVALDPPWHLSYPQVFKHAGEWYMLPESGQNGTIDLYKCEEMPTKWRHVRTLVRDIEAYDSTLIHHDGLWWIFSAVSDGHGISPYDELHIHYTDDLLTGAWHAHDANPVVSDVTRARPAGAFFKSGGKLYRPAQDSRGRYGHGLVIHEIETLTPTVYRERVARRLSVTRTRLGWCGLHTYNTSEGLAVIDFDRYHWPKAIRMMRGASQY